MPVDQEPEEISTPFRDFIREHCQRGGADDSPLDADDQSSREVRVSMKFLEEGKRCR